MPKALSNLSLMMALRGVAAIIFGVIALLSPGITLGALIAVFGAFALVDGVFALAAAISNSNLALPRWVVALDGAAGIAAGLVTFIAPGLTSLALLYLIATWSLLTGGMMIGSAISGPRFEPGWLMALDGAISIVFGFLLIAYPGDGIVAIVWALGVFALFSGGSMLVAAYWLRKGASAVGSMPGTPVSRVAV
jgi:uncharacterized membrane protein HdeD (DUF308 family)